MVVQYVLLVFLCGLQKKGRQDTIGNLNWCLVSVECAG